MSLSSKYPLSVFTEVASSLLGRALLFIATVSGSATLGISLATHSFIPPWTALMYFCLGGAGTLFLGGWGIMVFPVILLSMFFYLWKESSHYILLIPILVVSPFMFHLTKLLDN